MKKILFLCLVLGMLYGCVSFPQLPPRLGMTMQDVFNNYGPTFCKSSITDHRGIVDIWWYKPNPFTGKPMGAIDCRQATQRIYMVNGVVVGWENIR